MKKILLLFLVILIPFASAYNDNDIVRDGFNLWQYGHDINLRSRAIHNGTFDGVFIGISNGTNGTNGYNGTNGTNGINGSNLTVTVFENVNFSYWWNFSDGTKFLTSILRGASGVNGTNGTNGLNGINGTNGTNGYNGTNGSSAPKVNVSFRNNTLSCSHTAAATNLMAGFNVTYTTTANTTGTIMVSLNYQKTAPANVSLTSSDRIAYGTGAAPACNAAITGTVKGNTYLTYNPSALANKFRIDETIAISGLSPNTTYWIDIQSLSSTTAVWINSLPQITVIEP